MVQMKIYALTHVGHTLARSTDNPDTSSWKIVHELDRLGEATDERLEAATGLSHGEVVTALGTLRRNKIVSEISGAEAGMM